MRGHCEISSVIQNLLTPRGDCVVPYRGSDPCEGVPVSGENHWNQWRPSVGASIDDALEKEWTSLPTDRSLAPHCVLVWHAIPREHATDALPADILANGTVSAFTPDDAASLHARAGSRLVYDGIRESRFNHRVERSLPREQVDLQELVRVEV
jgi:hypothetical protein